MQNLDLRRTKRELEKVLEDKRNNLIRIQFDSYYANQRLPELENKLKLVHETVVQIDGELAVAKVPIRKERDNEKIVNLQNKLKELRGKQQRAEAEVNKARADAEKTKYWISESNKLIVVLERCIKDPKLIYKKNDK